MTLERYHIRRQSSSHYYVSKEMYVNVFIFNSSILFIYYFQQHAAAAGPLQLYKCNGLSRSFPFLLINSAFKVVLHYCSKIQQSSQVFACSPRSIFLTGKWEWLINDNSRLSWIPGKCQGQCKKKKIDSKIERKEK